MTAGLQRNVSRCSFYVLSCIAQSGNFCVFSPGKLVPTPAQDDLPPGNDTADPGIGVGAEKAFCGQLQCHGHALVIET